MKYAGVLAQLSQKKNLLESGYTFSTYLGEAIPYGSALSINGHKIH